MGKNGVTEKSTATESMHKRAEEANITTRSENSWRGNENQEEVQKAMTLLYANASPTDFEAKMRHFSLRRRIVINEKVGVVWLPKKATSIFLGTTGTVYHESSCGVNCSVEFTIPNGHYELQSNKFKANVSVPFSSTFWTKKESVVGSHYVVYNGLITKIHHRAGCN